ncbi:MAG TPA: thymidine phosphorylase, partial [Bdellovibrionota bacterium]|nr:thymidine phosphorylase [Bdellovibrionota bacterium]
RKLAHARLADGSAWKKFQEMVKAQGGDPTSLEKAGPGGLPVSSRRITWKSPKKGYLSRMDAREMGLLLVELGGGRKKAEDRVNPGVGMVFHRKLGSKVAVGDPLVTVYAPEGDMAPLEARFREALTFSPSRPRLPKLILDAGSK